MRPHTPNCPGQYEERLILHTTRYRGRILVIEGVPAEVCSFCGDTLFTPETSAALQQLVRQPPAADRTIPLYRYPTGAESAPAYRDAVAPGADAHRSE